MSNQHESVTRRDFVRTAAAASIAATFPASFDVFAQGSDAFKVGVIGCGGRGTGAAIDCLMADPAVEIVALGDLVPDRVEGSLARLTKEFPTRVKVPAGNRFTGFDNYKGVLSVPGVNLIVTAAPPGFRPIHVKAAVEAGKHVFMEKPVAVDPLGIRSILATADLAARKKLALVAGTQRRHQQRYLEMMKRIQDGQIGEIVAAQVYWNQGDLWVKEHLPGMSEIEWQCRNWLYFTWTSGDHIVEQHVHNIDVANWAMGVMPKNVMGMGGRQVRVGPQYGNIFDHFAVEFEYPNGVRVTSMCRQTKGCNDRVEERIVGTKGVAWSTSSATRITGAAPWTFEGEETNPYVQEHIDLIASIRKGAPLNEGRQVAESTLCAIMGRMSAYTGRALSWDWAMNTSTLDLSPEKYEFGPNPVHPVAVPGTTPLV
jgi:predicted dehydrogenase